MRDGVECQPPRLLGRVVAEYEGKRAVRYLVKDDGGDQDPE